MSVNTARALDLHAISDAYFAAWRARDPERIAAMHAPDTRFHLHTGGAPVEGRDAVRETFAGFFAQLPGLSFEANRVLVADDHWILDWTLTSGEARIGCLDVVTVSPQGLVARKDTYVDTGTFPAATAEATTPAGRRSTPGSMRLSATTSTR